jgi:hypothetical protein
VFAVCTEKPAHVIIHSHYGAKYQPEMGNRLPKLPRDLHSLGNRSGQETERLSLSHEARISR